MSKSAPPKETLLWIPGLSGPRLADKLQSQWSPVWVAGSADAAETYLIEHAIDRIITVYSDQWETGAGLWEGVPYHAVLIPHEPPDDLVARYPDVTFLQGPLPRNVIDWMTWVDQVQTAPADALIWDDSDDSIEAGDPPDATITWRESDEGTESERDKRSHSAPPAQVRNPSSGFLKVPQDPKTRPTLYPAGTPRGGHVPKGQANAWSHRTVACFSTAGGVGKTTTASILARLLQEAGRRVTIVEADEEKAGILRMFGYDPATNGLDMIPPMIWPDMGALAEKLEDIVVPINRQKGLPPILVYPLVGQLEGLQVENNEYFRQFLTMLQADADYLIVDLPPRLRDVVTIATLIVADAVVFVYEPTEPNLDAAIRHMHDVEVTQYFDRKKYALLINKDTARGLNVSAMARTVDLPLLGVIPEQTVVYHAMANTGRIVLGADSPWRGVLAALQRHVGDDAPIEIPNEPTHPGRTRGPKVSKSSGRDPSKSLIRRVFGT